MASVAYSPFMLSFSMFAFAFLVLFQLKVGPGHFSWTLNKADAPRLLTIFQYPSFAVLSIFFFLVLFSFWQTYDYQYWLARLRIKLPFLVFPLMFVALPRFTEKEVKGLFYVLLISLLITCLGIGANYLIHFDEINELLKQGQPMPTPHNHIRFSILLALGIIGGIYLVEEGYYWRYEVEKKWIIGITIFLFLFIHLLSVRSGLLSLYTALFMLTIRYILKTRRYWMGLTFIILLISIPVITYQLVPSFKSRIAYMKYDYYMYQRGEGALYSDSGRIVSLKVGMDIAKEHPWLGVGAGNLRAEVTRIFEEEYPNFEDAHMPHNQFLFVVAANGIIGLILFLFAFFFPIFYRRNFRHTILLGFSSIIFVAFMIEHSIENSIGVGFYIFFLSLLLSNLNKEI